MIIPSSVTDSIAAAGIDVSNDWLSATAPVWNSDYSAVLTQPISIATTPLADMRFLGVTTATITIRISSAPLSLVSWSGIATLVTDDTTGGGSPIYPVHNSFTGRDVADAHPLASITGLVDALDSKAPAFVSDGQRLFWATPSGGAGVPSLRPIVLADLPTLSFLPLAGGDVSGTIRSTVSGFKTWTTAILVSSTNPSILLQNTGNTADGRIWRIQATGAAQFGISSSDDTESAALNAISFSRSAGVLTARILTAGGSGTIILGGTLTTDLPTGFVRSTAGTLASSALIAADIPSLDTAKVTTGTFADARIASAATWNAKLSPSAVSGVTGNIAIFSGANSVSDNTGLYFDGTGLWCDGYIHGGGFKVGGSNFVDASRNIINGGSGTFSGALWGYGLRSTGNVTVDTGYALVMDSITRIGSTGIGNLSKLQIASLDVVGARKTGWTAATGTATRTTFATSTVTLPQLAERVKALLDDLIAHGLIGA